MTRVEVDGADEYRAAARRFAGDVAASTFLRRGRVEGGERVADGARTEAPRRTGVLARSIAVDARTAGTVEVVVQAAYGGPVHDGRGPGRRGGPMAPDPFLDRGIDRAERVYADALEEDLVRAIDRAF